MGRNVGRQVRASGGRNRNESMLTRMINAVFALVKFAEFELLFLLFFLIAFIIFKDLTSRPEYNQILAKRPGGIDFWAY